MDTTLNAHVSWTDRSLTASKFESTKHKLTEFFKHQAQYKTAWFLISLTFQGVFFLPIPSVITFYFGAPAYLVIITLAFFFANIIAGMSGMGVKTLIYLLAASIIANVTLLAVFTL